MLVRSGLIEQNGAGGAHLRSANRFSALTVQRVLWWLAGAHARLLEDESCWVERPRYTVAGLAVALTALIATAMMMLALAIVFPSVGPVTHLAGGLLWGAIILTIDRGLLLSLFKLSNGKLAMPVWAVLLRVGGAALISIMVGGTAELVIFERQLNLQIARDHEHELRAQQTRVDARYGRIAEITAEQRRLGNEREAAAAAANAAAAAAVNEADGTGGSGAKGAKGIYLIKKARADALAAETQLVASRNQAAIASLQRELTSLTAARDRELAAYQQTVTGADDVLARRVAMARLEADPTYGSTVTSTRWLVMLLSLFVELMPLVMKLTAPPGPYDAAYKAVKDGEAAKWRATEARAVERAAFETSQEASMTAASRIASETILAEAIVEAVGSDSARRAKASLIDELVERIVRTMRRASKRVFDDHFDRDVVSAADARRAEAADGIGTVAASRTAGFTDIDDAMRVANHKLRTSH